MEEIKVIHNETLLRFEVCMDGEFALLNYRN